VRRIGGAVTKLVPNRLIEPLMEPVLGLYRVRADTYDVAAMDTPKQDLYGVIELAKRNGRLTKVIDPDKLPRLQEASVGLASVASDVEFRFNEERLPVVAGQATAHVTLTCQTCDQPIAYELVAKFEMMLASTVRAAQLPRAADVRVIEDGQLALAELLEDELLLALPAQVCEDRNCENLPKLEFPIPASELAASEKQSQAHAASSTDETENPFAALQVLKDQLQDE
jgi:uncharacterized protein